MLAALPMTRSDFKLDGTGRGDTHNAPLAHQFLDCAPSSKEDKYEAYNDLVSVR